MFLQCGTMGGTIFQAIFWYPNPAPPDLPPPRRSRPLQKMTPPPTPLLTPSGVGVQNCTDLPPAFPPLMMCCGFRTQLLAEAVLRCMACRHQRCVHVLLKRTLRCVLGGYCARRKPTQCRVVVVCACVCVRVCDVRARVCVRMT